MNDLATVDAYGVLIEPTTLKIQRILPGPIERVWSYLTDSDLRRKWLAAGEMELTPGAPFEFVWRNNELTDPPGTPPEGFSEEHRMQCRIIEADPPRRLAFTWGESADVSIDLQERGKRVLLTLVHRRLADRSVVLNVGPGWHAHLDVLVARVSGTEPEPFWDHVASLRAEYRQRLGA